MTLREFIRQNREGIDGVIASVLRCPISEIPHKNDEERREWILNDEGLYAWARREGCRI